MKFGLIICSRLDSSRLPRKPFLQIDGRNLIDQLLGNCVDTGIPTVLAVPHEDETAYRRGIKHRSDGDVSIFPGVKDDPLKRMLHAAIEHGFDHIVRVCHDKIFIDHRQVREFINRYLDKKLEYIYSTNFIDGMGFEIFSVNALQRAALEFHNVEHVSFAVDAVTSKKENYPYFPRSKSWLEKQWPGNGLRLLIDHQLDYENICEVTSRLNGQINIDQVLKTIDRTAVRKNRQPFMTFYTCSYNDHEHLPEAIESVLSQTFTDFEYILLDDGSTEHQVLEIMNRYADTDKRIRVIRNHENLGLSSSSNLAVKQALGKYCMRVDADDYLMEPRILAEFIKKAYECHGDIIYPDYHRDGQLKQGNEFHHVGGALFRKRALDYIRFTDGLRHFDNKDIYHRARALRIKIDYWPVPVFYYRNRPGSLSNVMTPERRAVLEKLEAGG